jgi:hypothetical protein
LEVSYTDLAGRQPTKTSVEVMRDKKTGEWSIRDATPRLGDAAQKLFISAASQRR